jgi:hypothetical protein
MGTKLGNVVARAILVLAVLALLVICLFLFTPFPQWLQSLRVPAYAKPFLIEDRYKDEIARATELMKIPSEEERITRFREYFTMPEILQIMTSSDGHHNLRIYLDPVTSWSNESFCRPRPGYPVSAVGTATISQEKTQERPVICFSRWCQRSEKDRFILEIVFDRERLRTAMAREEAEAK